MSEYQHLDVSEHGDTILVRFKERHSLLDYAVPSTIGNELDQLADQPRCRKVVIDFSGVEHVSSFMLGLLVMLRRQIVSREGRLVMCGVDGAVRESFDSRLWDIRESVVDFNQGEPLPTLHVVGSQIGKAAPGYGTW